MVHGSDLYEQARSGGLSHETAESVVRASEPRIGRGPISGDWPPMPSDTTPVVDTGYSGPPPTTDSLLWLSKVGLALRSEWLTRQLVKNGLPLIERTRVRGFGGWKDGCVWLDVEFRHLAGELGRVTREYKSGRIPIEACIAHDTAYVLRRVLSGVLTDRGVQLVGSTLLSETDLSHVAG